ncbi:NAD-P-binding protein [Amylostereum chailletii]|nr:NAD-P-binding protein [Amylostereum chailletii]
MPSQLVWLITGTSSGLGRELAFEALDRGDKVVATARKHSFERLDDLKTAGAYTLELDVTAPLEELHVVAKNAVGVYGRVDVLVNNAGFAVFGAVEEMTPEKTLDQFNGNLLGPLNVARAFLPYMRAAKSGTILWNGSCKAWVPYVNVGLYAATKAAMHSISSTLHAEISPFGLRSLVIEPGYFRTSIITVATRSPTRIDDYHAALEPLQQMFDDYDGKQPGDPKKGAKIFVDVVRGEGAAAGRNISLALPLGPDAVKDIRTACKETLRQLEEWEAVCMSTDID